SSDGKMAGSVSNGCIEGAVYEEAQKVLESGEAKLPDYGVTDETAFEVGLACGGHIQVLISKANEVHDSLAEKLRENRPVYTETDLRNGEAALLLKAPDRDQPWREGDLFIEPFPRLAHMVIIGAIHIAIPLHRLAKLMGYRVSVVDARAKFATAERFPEADEVIVAWPDEALARIPVDRSTAVVILTHDPKFDMPALRAAQFVHVLFVRPLAGPGDLDDEGLVGQPRVVEQGVEPRLPDLALADVGMAVAVGAETGGGVVGVDGLQPCDSDHPLPLVQRVAGGFPGA